MSASSPRHQKTTLVRYCSNATPSGTQPSAPSSDASAGGNSSTKRKGKSKFGKRKGKRGQTDSGDIGNDSRRGGSRHLPSSEQTRSHRAESLPPTSTPSAVRINNDISTITEEEPLEYTIAASLTQRILKSNSNNTAHSMDAMRGRFGLTNWLSPSAKPSQASTQASELITERHIGFADLPDQQISEISASQLARQRCHARPSSDESWNSVHRYGKHRVDPDLPPLTNSSSGSMRSYEAVDHQEYGTADDMAGGSRQVNANVPQNDSYDLIEQDLDSMKGYITLLRTKADQAKPTQAQKELSLETEVEMTDSPPTDIAVGTPPYEAAVNESSRRESPAAILNRQHERQQLQERLARHAGSLAGSKSQPQPPPDPADFPSLSTGESKLSRFQSNPRRTSYASAATLAAKDAEAKPTPSGHTTKATTTPRFAQPTQAAVMRQTLRKDSGKTESPPSPGKSARVTESKRKSLPEVWTTSSSGGRAQRAAPATSTTSHGLDCSWDVVEAPQTLRKKGSFMSPTKATVQRTIATLGKENQERVSPRVKNAVQSMSQADGESLSKIPVRVPGDLGSSTKPVTAQLPACPDDDGRTRQVATATPFASVARTTVKPRRQSAEMLRPIIKRLQNQGLFDGRIATTLAGPVPRTIVSGIPAISQHPPDAKSSTLPQKLAALDDIARKTRQGVGNRKVVVPPNMKARTSSAGSTATLSSQATATAPLAVPPQGVSTEQARVSTLRADVPEFKPIWTPQTYAQQLSLYSWQGLLDEPSSERAKGMPSRVLESIETLRAFKEQGTRSRGDSTGTSLIDGQPLSKRQEQRWWGQIMSRSPALHGAQPAQQACMNVTPNGPGISPYGYGIGAQASCARTPVPIPREVFSTAKHGPGVADDRATGLTAKISPGSSDDTGPLPRLPVLPRQILPNADFADMNQPFAWQIDPALNLQPRQDRLCSKVGMAGTYGWSGGDGKEIRFTGYGPHAELDPNQSVHMQFFAPNAGNQIPFRGGAQPARRADASGSLPTARVWPRSMKQWAELAGAQKVPCNKAEVLQSAEMIPMANPEAALCNDCRP